ncbi:MAG: M56 family metallopeptidase [Pirellula sp.]
MISSQMFVINWIELAVASTILLILTKIVAYRLKQPIDRVNWIGSSLLLTTLVPAIFVAINAPGLNLGIISLVNDRPPSTVVPDIDSRANQNDESKDNRSVASSNQANFDFLSINRVEESPSDDEPTQKPAISQVPITETVTEPAVHPLLHHMTHGAPSSFSEPSRINAWAVFASLLTLCHSAVFFLFILQWILGRRLLADLIRRSSPASPIVLKLWGEITNNRGRSVQLLVTKDLNTPMVFGLRKHVILIPDRFAQNDTASLRFCLSHESCHILRGDLLRWHIVNLCQFLLWFQPLYWALRKELRLNQDLIADAHAAGSQAEPLARYAYSELLLSIAKDSVQLKVQNGMAFFDSKSQLARRIKMLISNEETLRERTTVRFNIVTCTVMFAISVLCGSLRFGSVNADVIDVNEVGLGIESGEYEIEGTTLINDTPGQEDGVRTISGRVVNKAGESVPGAKLFLPLQWQPRRIVQATTNNDGKFELKCPLSSLDFDSTRVESMLWVYAPGYSLQLTNIYEAMSGKKVDGYSIEISEEDQFRFKVLDPNGKPLQHANVKPHSYSVADNSFQVPDEMLGLFTKVTDEEGVVVFSEAQRYRIYSIEVDCQEFGRQIFRVERVEQDASKSEMTTVQLSVAGALKGRLTAEKPEWVKGVPISFTTGNLFDERRPTGIVKVVTNDQGEFHVSRIASGGPLHVYVDLDRELPVRPRLPKNTVIPTGETCEFDIPLVNATMVKGKVLSKTTGAPVRGAHISLTYGGVYPWPDYGSGTTSVQVSTDQNGEFKTRVLPGNLNIHFFSLPRGVMRLRPSDEPSYVVPSGNTEFELPSFELVNTKDLAGLLLGHDGNPIPNVDIRAFHGRNAHGFGKSDDHGQFKMTVPDVGELRYEALNEYQNLQPADIIQTDPLVVKVVDSGRKQTENDEREEAARSQKPNVVLSGRVLLSQMPFENVRVIVTRYRSKFTEPYEITGKPLPPQVIETKTDVAGRYRFEEMKAGDRYSIAFEPDIAVGDPRIKRSRGNTYTIPENLESEAVLEDVNMVPLDQEIAGQVVDLDGKPIQGANIVVRLRTGEYLNSFRTAGPAYSTQSDAKGKFKLKELPGEPLRITAYLTDTNRLDVKFDSHIDVELNQKDIRVVLDPSLIDEDY